MHGAEPGPIVGHAGKQAMIRITFQANCSDSSHGLCAQLQHFSPPMRVLRGLPQSSSPDMTTKTAASGILEELGYSLTLTIASDGS